MRKLKLTEKDDAQRTTAIGFFNFAESYWKAAAFLDRAKLKSTHAHSPIAFLYYHAIELYLKSFLRMKGHLPTELASRKFGHHTGRLKKRAAELGLSFMDEDEEVISLMTTTDALIRSRYIQTGSFQWPAPEALDRTCKSLRISVGQALKKNGVPVRLSA